MTLPLLQAATRKAPGPDGEELFACQTTELNRATVPQPFLEVAQYVTDYKSGNANLFWIVRAFLVGLFNRLQDRTHEGPAAQAVVPRRTALAVPDRARSSAAPRPRNSTCSLASECASSRRMRSRRRSTADLLNRGYGLRRRDVPVLRPGGHRQASCRPRDRREDLSDGAHEDTRASCSRAWSARARTRRPAHASGSASGARSGSTASRIQRHRQWGAARCRDAVRVERRSWRR